MIQGCETGKGVSRMISKANQNFEAGFTVIEVVFVMVVLAILVSIATMTYSGLQTQTTKNMVMVDLKVIRSAARTYHMKHQVFPAAPVNLANDGYLDELPKDKFAPDFDYLFDASNPSLFKIWSRGPNGIDNGGAADDLILAFGP